MNNSRDCKPGFGRFRRQVIATSLAAMLVLAGGVGHALAQDDEDDELPDTKFFKSMLQGLGLKKDGMQSNGITYQERPPLVVPPTRDLPPPQSADAVRGNAAWPKDQDEQRRRQAAVKRKKEAKPFDWSDLGAQMSPNELKKGATTAKDDAIARKPQDFEQYNRQYKPSELGYAGGLFGSVKDFFGVNGRHPDRDVRGRAAAREPDRSADRLPVAVAGAALRRGQGHQQDRADEGRGPAGLGH